MRSFRSLIVGLALTALLSGLANAAQYSLVRIHFDGQDGQAFLAAHPELDVASVKPGIGADIVVDRDQIMDTLRASGLRLEVVHKDLVAHYAARIQNKDTNFGGWHTYSENAAYLDSLRTEYPTLISQKWSIGQTHEFRDIWCVRLSDNPDVDETGEPEILLDTMHHAREIMSSEFGIMFADYLCRNYGSDPVVTWLMDNRELYIVSIVNPDGVVYNEQTNPAGGGMWRKNRRYNSPGVYGVDPNRNYPFQWVGPGSDTDPSSETYRGPQAGSEPEVQALMGLVNSHQFVTHQSMHTYQGLTLIPWGYTSVDTPDHATFMHMAEIMTQYNGYAYGQTPDLLYAVNGVTTDWTYADGLGHDRIFSFSNEVGTTGFWPSFAERDQLFEENVWPMLYLMMAAGAYAQVDGAVATDLGGGLLEPGEQGRLAFQISNLGVTESLAGVQVRLSCDDPYVQFDEVVRNVGNLAPMGSTAIAPLPFAVSAACPAGHPVQATVTIGTITYPVAFLVGNPTSIFFDDFSAGTGNWTFSGGPWGLTGTAHSAPNALTDSPSGDYDDNLSATATINGEFLASELSFWHRYDIEQGYDYGRVQVSANGGAWQTVTSFTGTHTAWQQVNLDLTPYANGGPVRVRFLLTSDTWITGDGWYIDDVTLLGAGSDNGVPPAPMLVAPANGETVDGAVELVVANVSDPDGDPVSYGFRVYADPDLTQLVAGADGVPAGAGGQTAWTATLGLGGYYWRAYAADPTEWGSLGDVGTFSVGTTTGVDGVVIGAPRLAVLGSGGGRAELQLSLPRAGELTVKVYNARGQLVRRLFGGAADAGTRTLVWDGRDSGGRPAASGVYLVRATAGPDVLKGRVVLVR
ncbi:MAG: M14 family zinc carboxypeptidase [Candidatus Krumholzibacteriia bacterium]